MRHKLTKISNTQKPCSCEMCCRAIKTHDPAFKITLFTLKPKSWYFCRICGELFEFADLSYVSDIDDVIFQLHDQKSIADKVKWEDRG